MKRIIRIITLLLALLMLSGCVVEEDEKVNSWEAGGEDTDGATEATGGEPTGEASNATFSATLVLGGQPFIPAEPVTVQWSDGYQYERAEVDASGKASVTGLDGDYQVTLVNIPDGYTYNPNIYRATNSNRDITIELFELTTIRTRDKGTNYYDDIIEITHTGYYRAEITKENQAVYFQFVPKRSGSYSMESWMDVTAEKYNPILDVHEGSAGYKNPVPTVTDGGGTSSGFTTNFRYVMNVDDSNIGANGGILFAFGIRVTSKDGTYPVYVDFALQYDGSYAMESLQSDLIIPSMLPTTTEQKAIFDRVISESTGAYRGAEITENGLKIFKASCYKLNPETGYYHLYSSADDTYGPVLFANITSPNRFIDKGFSLIEYEGNRNLTLSEGTENYKLFIEGYNSLVAHDYFCIPSCPCAGGEQHHACVSPCANCTEDCRTCPRELVGQQGYADFVNADGRTPVTEELKEFLQKYALAQRLFMDGNGFAETSYTPAFGASEDDQWLFACGYYTG